jgi:cell division septation protein DedD
MSAQDDGGGPGSGRSARGNEVFGHPLDAAQHFFSQSDPQTASRSNSNSVGNAPSLQTWGNNALDAQQSEVSLMAQGPGRPGQPAGGQRPIFGGGSPVFAQMPSYTPVTRGPELRPQAPQLQPAYTPYNPGPAPAQPSQQAASGLSYPSPQAPSPLSYPSQHPSAAPSYPSPHPGAAQSYQNAQPQAAPSYQNFQPAMPSQPDYASSGYQTANQPVRQQSFQNAEHPGAQGYPAASYNGAQGYPSQPFGNQNYADASFPEPGSGDASFPESNFDQNFTDQNFGNQNFAKANFADASFPESQGFDASFPDTSFPSAHGFAQQEPATNYGHDARADQGFDSFHSEPSQDYGQVPQSDPRRQLQAFDAIYDQPPQISLGSAEPSRRPAQDFYEGERLDADFLDEGQAIPAPGARAKSGMTFKGRSAFMVGSALLGAIALGGALAFAYKQSGGGLGSEQPPLVTADSRPVKELPDDPGGKDFPHKNKLIYDRLQNGDEPESERLVPRQENVAVPALPPSPDSAGTPAPVATTDLATPTTQSVGGAEPVAVASADDSMPDGGPRKVKTMVVRPDGTMADPPADAAAAEAPAAPEAAAPDAQLATAAAAPAAAEPQEVASLQAPPAPAPKPKPAAKPAVQTAAATPAAAAGPTKYVVQVGSKKNQTDALASFADMQQKYPTLLANYRPMVQKADLGTKGTWYRLRIGPIADKTAATKLCGQLKSQGLPDCLVMAQ